MSWICDCGQTVAAEAIICPNCGAGAAGADPHLVNLALQRDKVMEGHLQALALWQRLGGGLAAIAGIWLLVAGNNNRHGGDLGGMISAAATMTGVILLLSGAVSYLLGHFLARYANWARITAGVFATLALTLFVVMLALGLYAIATAPVIRSPYYLDSGPSVFGVLGRAAITVSWFAAVTWAYLNSRAWTICSPSYHDVIAATPTVKPATWKSLFFVVPCVLLAISLGLAAILFLSGRQF